MNSSLIVSDPGPLIALAKTNQLHLLESLFEYIMIPEEVAGELCLQHPMAGSKSLLTAVQRKFIRIKNPQQILAFRRASVDPGEAAAISLAAETHLPLLIDDASGRKAARDYKILIFGTGALLLKAKREGLIQDIQSGLDALCACGYHFAPSLYDQLLKMADEQRLESNQT